ncbi:hypothetical protein KP509_01G076700 [Ceratopteris richardii]|uniref:Late embryogenesis abundant protein LEA-2 subgroup domain-containing protein n=1 Tax=Ceratopteris richardii TaxID=49495 RepID=A0A8T2VQT9_CERRI|nr:hypothetical protein KP509_01G076700 [Ceratopteris richardii]
MHSHTKSDSEVTSLAPSSPRSPRSRPLYFVQSPSRESHDGDSKLSFHSTPVLSPIGSPLHPGAFSTSSRSRESSQSLAPPGRKSGRKILPQPHGASRSKHTKGWAANNVIEEEGPDFDQPAKNPLIYTILLVIFSCIVILIVFILLFWLICRPSHPELSLKNVIFHNFYAYEGTDASGVPTQLLTMNSSVQLDFYNPSKYFGVRVIPVEAVFTLSELEVARGEISKYSQAKGARRTIVVVAQSRKIPLYGAGNVISNSDGSTKQGVPLTMVATLHSQYYVVGKMIKPTFQNQVVCNIELDSKTMALLTPLKKSCTYTT